MVCGYICFGQTERETRVVQGFPDGGNGHRLLGQLFLDCGFEGLIYADICVSKRESVGKICLRFPGREERHGLLGQLFLGCSFEGLLYADRYVLAKEKGKAV